MAAGRVVRPGKKLMVCLGEVFAEEAGKRKQVALMTASMVVINTSTGLRAQGFRFSRGSRLPSLSRQPIAISSSSCRLDGSYPASASASIMQPMQWPPMQREGSSPSTIKGRSQRLQVGAGLLIG